MTFLIGLGIGIVIGGVTVIVLIGWAISDDHALMKAPKKPQRLY